MIDNSVNPEVGDESKSSFRMDVAPKTDSNSNMVNMIRIIATCDMDDINLEGASDGNGRIEESKLGNWVGTIRSFAACKTDNNILGATNDESAQMEKPKRGNWVAMGLPNMIKYE